MIKQKLSLLAIILVGVICIWNAFNLQSWKSSGIVCWDAGVYYIYLPKIFKVPEDSLNEARLRFPGVEAGINYILLKDPNTSNGDRVIKTTMGMAFLYTPFYLSAWLQHYFNYGDGGTGYNIEYRRTMEFFGMACLLLSLIILRKLLKRYFNDAIVALTLIAIALGTNAFYYSDYEGCMTHVPDLMLFALFMLLTERWYNKPNPANSILLGLLTGLLSLVRPTNIILLIFFFLYNISTRKELAERISLLFKKWHLLLMVGIMTMVVWAPQMFYWHYLTGKYFYYSYTGEAFNFSNPQILNGLLSGRKGWLIYTPIGWLMLMGFIPMRRYVPKLVLPVFLLFICHIYIIFSWWSWWYGGSFSSRPMVEAYAFLAFPLASLFHWFYITLRQLTLKIVFSVILFLLIALNLFQTYQYTHGYIHYSDMTFAAYKDVFLQLHKPADNLLEHPL